MYPPKQYITETNQDQDRNQCATDNKRWTSSEADWSRNIWKRLRIKVGSNNIFLDSWIKSCEGTYQLHLAYVLFGNACGYLGVV